LDTALSTLKASCFWPLGGGEHGPDPATGPTGSRSRRTSSATRSFRKLAEEKGVHYAKEASGHRSDRYIWRYVKPNTESLADTIDGLH
jgi:hypothetical protein